MDQQEKSLRRLRMEQEMKLVDLARKATVSAAALWYWENGQRMPSIENVEKLARALELPVEVVSAAIRESRKRSQATALAPTSAIAS